MRLSLLLIFCIAISSCVHREGSSQAISNDVIEWEQRLRVPAISSFNEDVIRVTHVGLFAGDEIYVCYIFPKSEKMVYYPVAETEVGDEHFVRKNDLNADKVLATKFWKAKATTFEDSGTLDGSEYIVETLFDNKYNRVVYNNPDNVRTQEAQLVARAMDIIDSVFN
jgi:hypothetical protein